MKYAKLTYICFSLLLFSSCADQSTDVWQDLIIDNSLEGWHIFQDNGAKKGWIVEDEILTFNGVSDMETGEGDASLLSNKKYENFEIKFDWKIEDGGNSGFMWGVSEDTIYHYPYQTGLEIQILDHATYKEPNDVLGGEIEVQNVLDDLGAYKHYVGALYDLSAPNIIDAAKPANQWNSYRIKIDHKSNHGEVELNGQLINTFPLHGDGWDAMMKNSKFNRPEDFPYLGNARWSGVAKFKKGSICFQDHPGKADFRNIKIRELE